MGSLFYTYLYLSWNLMNMKIWKKTIPQMIDF